MIIKRLEMFNFRQYMGHQAVDFSIDPERNVTVLIGVNTSGKTTLVRAFEWCLYGKNGFDDPVLLNSDVRGNMNVGDVQETWVAVTFFHDDKEYTIKRSFRYVCKERKSSSNAFGTEVSLSKKPEEKLTLEYLQADGQTKTPIDRTNIAESIDRVLPRDLSDYFFFGGERVSTIASRPDLTRAVHGLMRLDVFENARDHLSKVIKNFQSSIDTSGDQQAQKAKDAIETYKNQLAAFEEEKENADSQIQYWLQKENEYSNELSKSNIEQIKEAKKNRDRIEKSIEAEEKKLSNTTRAMVEAFNTRPYAFFGMPAIKQALELLDTVSDTAECVPDMMQSSIEYLLKRGYCICGTHLDPGSVPYSKIMEEYKIQPPGHTASAAANYRAKAEGYLAGSEAFLTTLENRFKERRAIKRTIGQLLDDYKQQSDLIVDDSTAKVIDAKRREAHEKYIEAKQDLEAAISKVGRCKGDIENCEETVNKYAKSSAKNSKIAMRIAYASAAYDWINTTYVDKERTVRTELEKRVNDNFSQMYHGERTIEIDEKYRVKYSNIKTEESDGLKAVKSFAFIASLVSMAKDKILDDQELKLGQEYPVVMDAPFSNVDEIHINNICKILPCTANQVIMAVMKKDWDNAVANLEPYVGKSYIIEKDRDAEGLEIETSTHIIPTEV